MACVMVELNKLRPEEERYNYPFAESGLDED
jgi:hypothetical protein